MKTKKEIKTIILLLGILFTSSPIYSTITSFNKIGEKEAFEDVNDLEKKLNNALDTSSIFIDDLDPSCNWATTATSQPWCTGSGTESDPYIIDGVIVDGQNSGNCIEIRNSEVYFEIRNCKVYNAEGLEYAGIKLKNVINGTLINNNCSNNNAIGIYLDYCNYIHISGNTVNNNGDPINPLSENVGIMLSNSFFNEITKTYINHNYDYGISLVNSDSNYILDNDISSNQIGIIGNNCNNNLIIGNNLISNEKDGIQLLNCKENNILNNEIKNNADRGVYLGSNCVCNDIYHNNFIDNNINVEDEGLNNRWDNGARGNFWSDYTGVDADDDAIGDAPYIVSGTSGSQDNFPIWNDGAEPIFIDGEASGFGAHNWTWAEGRFWCSGSGTFSNPYMINGVEIDGQVFGSSIFISNSHDIYFIIKDCKVYNAAGIENAGIKLKNVKNAQLIDNDCSNNNAHGILLVDCNNCTISQNTANSNSKSGIRLARSSHNKIYKNIIENNENFGICITFEPSLPPYAYNGNEISENTVRFNDESGIYLSYSIGANCSRNIFYQNPRGIDLITSHETIISGNLIDTNWNYGIFLTWSWTNKVFNNQIMKSELCIFGKCSGTGVYVDELSLYNAFYNNSFSDNYINAMNEGVENKWNKGSIGNYWDDYRGVDDDDDGKGDTPYTRYGVIDNFPIWNDGFNGRPIYIDGSATGVGAHNWTWARSRIWCTGSGSISDPYIIENLEIDGQNSENCIEIWNSDVYFIIRNCKLYNSGTGMYSAGISLGKVTNGKLINNIFPQNNICGIFLDECYNINITNNTIKQSGSYGIHSYDCKYCEISENIIIENHVGIRVHSGDHNVILKNEIRENDYGISLSYNNGVIFSGNIVNDNLIFGLELWDCTGSNFFNNQIKNNRDGIILRDSDDNHFSRNIVNFNIDNGVFVSVVSENNTFYNNIFSNNDINANDDGVVNKWDNGIIGNYWSDYQGSDDDNDGIGDTAYQINVVDNFPIYENPRYQGERIRIDGTGIDYRSWSQTAFLKWWCRGSGTISDPYVISNLTVNGQYYHNCILIMDSQDHFIIKNCKVFNSGLFYFGIKLEYVENGQLINNDCSDNIGAGIRLEHCNYNKISGNTINAIVQNVPIGIRLSDSDNNEISDNIITNNYRGIVASGDHNKFSNNKINNNVDGIYLTYGNDNFFSGNIINYNENEGILLSNCNGNDFLNNILAFNGNYGIQLSSSCENNVLTENNFFRNNINAVDDGIDNRWNNSARGNFWSDYLGGDADYNNIGDTPYNVSGTAWSQDHHPIIKTGGNRTLILVHGFDLGSNTPGGWSKIEKRFKEYYDNIITIVYYHNPDDMRDEEGNGVDITNNNRIQTVSKCLRNYIIDHHYEISDNVDFICHSMGGLVVRYMIKHYFDEIMLAYLNRGRLLRINHIAMLGTPNHGAQSLKVLLGNPYIPIFIAPIQVKQMLPMWNPLNKYAPFLRRLNNPNNKRGSLWCKNEAPYNEIIEWYTYSGWIDELVGPISPQLDGAKNRGPYWSSHTDLKKKSEVLDQLEIDLDLVPPPVISAEEDNIILAPEPAPSIGTDTVSELEVQLEADAILDPSSVTFNVNPEFEMNLVRGSMNTYEVDLTLPEGTHHYTITARDFHGNSYNWEGEITIVDDDTSYPYINFKQQDLILSDEEAKEGVLLEWQITDESGISEALVKLNGDIIRSYGPADEISDSYLLTSNIPGTYTLELWARDNDNDPGHENDWLESLVQYNITIYDDDTTPPKSFISYSGLNLDSDPGIWNINIMDQEEGIDEVRILVDGIEFLHEQNLCGTDSKFYSIPVPNALGIHEIEIIVKDNDKDWDGDQESITNSSSVYIFDDDIDPPEIVISYIGSGYDNDPGYFEWNIFDIDSGISEINITITYESTEGLNDYTISLVGTETGSWNLPPNLGIYTIKIFARDNDDDRTLIVDSLTTELTRDQEIVDDDIDPPELSNLVIIRDIFEINVTFDATDESGIGNISTFINGELIEPLTQVQYGNTYSLIFKNQWLFEFGTSEVIIQVEDGDDDRPNDTLTSLITGSFENILSQMYEYVDWQLEELKNYIDENLSPCVARFLNRKLTRAQDHLYEAFSYIENGSITCGLFHDAIAKVMVQITEFKVELLNRFDRIDDEQAEYIIDSLHEIRNNIVLLMGASIGEEQAYKIALIEVELLNLKDFIEDEIPCCVGRCLSAKISCSATLLELALFKISKGYSIDCILECAQRKLDHAITKINFLLEKGKIPEDVANYLIEKISSIIGDIEQLKNN